MRERIGTLAAVLLLLGLLASCAPRHASTPETLSASPVQTAEPLSVVTLAPTPAPTPEPTATPEPTPEPTPSVAKIGAVGDIMVMQSQISGAYDKASDSYDFTRSFTGMRELFGSVDLLCGNLETTLSGKAAGYTVRQPSGTRFPSFNAPDELADSLKAVGFDVLTTANNHCLDRDTDGLFRTVEVVRAAGLYQTGTARTQAERDTPLVIDVNGIRIGIVAATENINSNDRMLSEEESKFAVTRLYRNRPLLEQDIRRCREAGAEFVIAFLHWDDELVSRQDGVTERCAKDILAAGADVILGSHPHVVQQVKNVTVTRDGADYTGLVVYSMGNFISNMSPAPKTYGMLVSLTVVKELDGTVRLAEASYMPTLCFYRSVDGKYLHQVVPALADTSLIASESELTAANRKEASAARKHVLSVCGTDAIPVMEDLCWRNSEN